VVAELTDRAAVDNRSEEVHTAGMGGYAAQLQISDRRDGARHLRLSWHATRRVVVFSHWRDGVCVASTPVEVAEIPTMIEVLVKALADTSRSPTSEASTRVGASRLIPAEREHEWTSTWFSSTWAGCWSA